jgi:hypothetical protein
LIGWLGRHREFFRSPHFLSWSPRHTYLFMPYYMTSRFGYEFNLSDVNTIVIRWNLFTGSSRSSMVFLPVTSQRENLGKALKRLDRPFRCMEQVADDGASRLFDYKRLTWYLLKTARKFEHQSFMPSFHPDLVPSLFYYIRFLYVSCTDPQRYTGANLDISRSLLPYLMNRKGTGSPKHETPPRTLAAGPTP